MNETCDFQINMMKIKSVFITSIFCLLYTGSQMGNYAFKRVSHLDVGHPSMKKVVLTKRQWAYGGNHCSLLKLREQYNYMRNIFHCLLPVKICDIFRLYISKYFIINYELRASILHNTILLQVIENRWIHKMKFPILNVTYFAITFLLATIMKLQYNLSLIKIFTTKLYLL